MLFIYSELAIGGIQTFYVRMAKARHALGKKTKFLLVRERRFCDPQLLEEAMKYADVYFLDDIANVSAKNLKIIPSSCLLLTPLKRSAVEDVLDGVGHAHVSNAIYALFYMRMARIACKAAKYTIGVYHFREFVWDFEGRTPYFQRINKEVFSSEPRNRVFFNERVLSGYESHFHCSLHASSLFPLGVIPEGVGKILKHTERKCQQLLIVSIGRLVHFKSYNLWMIDVVAQLVGQGASVIYHIYGDGPLKHAMQEKINSLQMNEHIQLKGTLAYNEISSVLQSADLFVGSGTSIIDASALGVPSIIGIESEQEPMTYGYLCDVPGFSYNENDLYPKTKVMDIITDYLKANKEEVLSLSRRHIEKASIFTVEACERNFAAIDIQKTPVNELVKYTSLTLRLKYSITKFIIPRIYLVMGKNPAKLIYG